MTLRKGKMAEVKEVIIVMATYNGAFHIKKQLDSLLAQTYQNLKIVIRDDGSEDATIKIIKEYQARTDKITLLKCDGKNLKCPGSFYEILEQCPKSDYYAFCDQDDIWYPEKIQWAVEKLNQYGREEPLLYLSSYDYYTEEGKFIRKFPIQKEPIRIRNVMYYTPGSGFTLVFNEQLRKKMVVDCKPGNEMHDKWMIRGAICFGKIVYDSRSTAKHIRYADSVTAEDAGNTNLLIHFIRDELLADTAVEAKEYLKYFYDAFSNEMKPYDKKAMEIFIDDSNNLKSWLRKIFYPHRLRTRISGEIALRILFMIGKI